MRFTGSGLAFFVSTLFLTFACLCGRTPDRGRATVRGAGGGLTTAAGGVTTAGGGAAGAGGGVTGAGGGGAGG
jgi:hypothetical protein